MQDEIVIRLSRALSIQFVDVELARAMRTRPGNLEAQDLALQCVSNLIKSPDFSIGPCRRALQLDSGNALALGILAFATIYPVIISQSDNPKAAIKQADELASRALAADPNVPGGHVAKAWVLMADGRHEEAIVEAEKSLALNPSAIDGYLVIGIANNFLTRPDRSLEMVEHRQLRFLRGADAAIGIENDDADSIHALKGVSDGAPRVT